MVADRIETVFSVLMPTYRNAWCVTAALESVFAQREKRWELIVIDDGSDDETTEVIRPYADDPRVRVITNDGNRGLGACLGMGTRAARGELLAYLPSDDVWYADHLERAARVLADDDVHLAYGGLRCHRIRGGWEGMSLLGDVAIDERWRERLADRPTHDVFGAHAANLLKLVQVVHRRTLEPVIGWPTREQRVSDQIEGDFWKALLAKGARFAYTGTLTCEWTIHPNQRHTIIAGGPRSPLVTSAAAGRGLSAYRAYYRVPKDTLVEWCPSNAPAVSERRLYADLRDYRPVVPGGRFARPGSVLFVGELGYNPERILAFEREGIRTYGLWSPHIEYWDTASSVPFSDCRQIPYAPGWRERVREAAPDVVYALLNFQALPLIHEFITADLGFPVVFHFKESPFEAMRYGMWPMLAEALMRADGVIHLNSLAREWFETRIPGLRRGNRPVACLDGEFPLAARMRDDWSPKLSSRGGLHTVCVGRPIGLENLRELVARGIHVHVYRADAERWLASVGGGSPYLHAHPPVAPREWTKELSRYDAGWLHADGTAHGAETIGLTWRHMNLPARLSTYASAGLPWLIRRTTGRRGAVAELAGRYGVGIEFDDLSELADRLSDTGHRAELTANAVSSRFAFSMEHNLPFLAGFLERCSH